MNEVILCFLVYTIFVKIFRVIYVNCLVPKEGRAGGVCQNSLAAVVEEDPQSATFIGREGSRVVSRRGVLSLVGRRSIVSGACVVDIASAF